MEIRRCIGSHDVAIVRGAVQLELAFALRVRVLAGHHDERHYAQRPPINVVAVPGEPRSQQSVPVPVEGL